MIAGILKGMGDLMTTGQAADALGVSAVTLQRWAHEGKVKPALRTAGGHFRWNLADLRRELAELHQERDQ